MSLFACCIRRRHLRVDEKKISIVMEPPEISWENSLGSPNGVAFDDETKDLVMDCMGVPIPPPVNLSTLIKKSDAFPVPFPIKTVQSAALKSRGVSEDILEFNANSAYPIIHEAMLPLISAWLKHKREHGSNVERTIYRNMGLMKFIQRLLEKRSVVFYGGGDRWKLIDNTAGSGKWETVGTDQEKEPLVLDKCLSYDEIKISALMVVSSHSEFINDGSRENGGIICNDPDSLQPRGVIMGVIGSRFERQQLMEYQDIVITPPQNRTDNGYGPPVEGSSDHVRGLRVIWSRFYGEDYHLLYEEAVKRVKSKENKRYVALSSQKLFDIENYMKRTLLSVEILLLEANTRAEKQNTTAFLHVVGFGLGVWRIMDEQEKYFLKTFEIALKKMNRKLKFVSDIMFAYFREQKCGGAGNGDYLGDIKIHFALREPHSKLFRPTDANKLLVVTYAWDGNAHPGNEFWDSFLTISGDPAAACSTQVAELHNTRINPRACASSLHIASPEHGLLHISEMSPMGTEQRRFSRSPRSQRSRSADVDRLRKYAERIEERRNTEGADATRLYASRWLPLPRSPNFPDRSDSDSRIEFTESSEKLVLRKGSSTSRDDTENTSRTDSRWGSMQSDSDVTIGSSTDIHLCPDGRLMSFRWIPLPRLGDRPDYTQKTLSIELHSARNAANRWITFAKHPSPASSRSNLDRKSSMIKFSSYYEKEMRKNRKQIETVATTDEESGKTSPNADARAKVGPLKREASRRSILLSQRIRELYKFKFDSDWSKRTSNASSTSSYWISKSSSDEDDDSTGRISKRRSSQDLEFNDRTQRKFSNFKSQLFKRFNERLRFSEDITSKNPVKYDRKAFSEDYGDSQISHHRSWPSKLDVNDETESTDTSVNGPPREKRKSSGIVKRGSVECRSTSKVQIPPRRALSYGAENRPPTPVPPADIIADLLPCKSMTLRQKRKSTRYKVYLT